MLSVDLVPGEFAAGGVRDVDVRLLEFGRGHDLLLGTGERPGARRAGENPLVSVAHAGRGRWTRTC